MERAHLRRVFALLAALAWLLAASAARASEPVREIVINIPAFRLYLYEDGAQTLTFPIGVGRIVNPSQLGPTTIINEVVNPTYYPPDWYRLGLAPIPPGPENPVGTRWLGLGFRGYGIHGTNAPETIGTAASAGCIRMYNEDVETLAEYVGVGTTVTFLYETVEAWRDPLLGRPHLRVYEDIYSQGTNVRARALEALARIGASEGVHLEMLDAMLAEAAGTPYAVPQSVPLFVGTERAGFDAVAMGSRLLISLHAMAGRFGGEVAKVEVSGRELASVSGRIVEDSQWVGGRAFAPVEKAAQAFGFGVVEADEARVVIEPVRLVDERGARLELTAYPGAQWVLLPVQDLANLFGVPIAWDRDLGAVRLDGRPIFGAQLIGGKAYLPHDLVGSLLGVEIAWAPAERTATLRVPKVHFADTVEQGFVYDEQVYVPLRPITDLLGYPLGWSQELQTAYIRGIPVKGILRGGRIYAPLASLVNALPILEYVWDEEELDLVLRFERN